jgi:hypothetical protein
VARDPGRLDKPWESQPEGGMRFTSQTGRDHGGRLGQRTLNPADPIQVGGSSTASEDVPLDAGPANRLKLLSSYELLLGPAP